MAPLAVDRQQEKIEVIVRSLASGRTDFTAAIE
jgi:hypothetical protein